jgi:hypothetical protein
MNIHQYILLTTPYIGVRRYEAYCISLAAQLCVAPPRKGMAIARRLALICTAMNMHYTSSNYGF